MFKAITLILLILRMTLLMLSHLIMKVYQKYHFSSRLVLKRKTIININLFSVFSTTTKDDVIRAKEILIQHQKKVIIEEDFQRVHIRRKSLYSDALHAFSRLTFNASRMLRVTFIGEPAIDDGGPRREFFGFLMRNVFSISGLFTGWPSNVVPIHSIEGVSTNKFFVVGVMMATCLIQGGEAPLFC